MATVKLTAVTKKYQHHTILDDINLEIEKGEFVVLVGPSGSGKSTLLRIVAGLEKFNSGNILINNECVNKIPPSKRDMAMVFQNYALYPHMTVFDNIAYGLKMRGVKKSDRKQLVEDTAEILQIRDYLHRKPSDLSGGQKQRVAMGRAMVRSPAVFLFDEPLSNLDAKLRTEMRFEIKKLHQQLNRTSLYVTHDQTEAMTLADKIIVLNQGKIAQIGTPKDLYEKPGTLFVGDFIGHYPINYIPGRIDYSARKTVTEIGVELPLPHLTQQPETEHIFIGIRSEHLYIQSASDVPLKSFIGQVEFVEDMGADKLVKIKTKVGGLPLWVRVTANMCFEKEFRFELLTAKANIFCRQSGLRIGEWNE